ncbi:hypothetical protein KUL118_32540 [Tenacibaculum sp. KUL118]|nr:hypothetical protein KUL118_32540 [Tenacibaculum sp. KUL118]
MDINKKDLLEEVANRTRIYEGVEGVRTILRTIHTYSPIGAKDVSKHTNIPIPIISAVRRELERNNILNRKNGMILSDEGINYVHNILKFGKNLELTKHEILSPNFVVPKSLNSILTEMKNYVKMAPKYNATIDQTPCTAETAIRRALLMFVQGAIDGKRIALIGDDDLISIALCLVAKYLGSIRSIELTVFDIDSRFIDFIKSITYKNNFPITCIKHDMRMPIPKKFLHKFDVIETDPPYSLKGAFLFLSRGLELLIQAPEKCIIFSFAHWPSDKKIKLEKMFNELGMSVENQHRSFNIYQGASILGSTGTLFELRTSSKVNLALKDKIFTDSIYTFEQPKKNTHAK